MWLRAACALLPGSPAPKRAAPKDEAEPPRSAHQPRAAAHASNCLHPARFAPLWRRLFARCQVPVTHELASESPRFLHSDCGVLHCGHGVLCQVGSQRELAQRLPVEDPCDTPLGHARIVRGQRWCALLPLFFHLPPPARSPACLSRAVFGIFNMLLILPVMRWAFLAPVALGSAGVFGFTVGVSIFGTAYMVVHDGVVHGRFWTGSLGQVESIRRWPRRTRCTKTAGPAARVPRAARARRGGAGFRALPMPIALKAACWLRWRLDSIASVHGVVLAVCVPPPELRTRRQVCALFISVKISDYLRDAVLLFPFACRLLAAMSRAGRGSGIGTEPG